MLTFNRYIFYGPCQIRLMMLLQRSFTGILILACSMRSIAQTTASSQQDNKHFAVYAGFGPNYYFNNLQIGKDLVNEFNYSFTGRFMWEPGRLVGLGFETGYYRLYTLNGLPPSQAHITNTAIPIQIVISMKFLQKFYFNLSMGQSILHNKDVSETYGDFSTHALSVADFSGTLGYRHMLNSRFSIAGEAKFYYSSSFVDRNIALLFVGGYRF